MLYVLEQRPGAQQVKSDKSHEGATSSGRCSRIAL